MTNREHDPSKHGPADLESHRWRRVVEQLDKYYPEWRKGAGYAEDPVAFIGDAAVLAIGQLALTHRSPLPDITEPKAETIKGKLIGYTARRADTSLAAVDFETAKQRAIKWADMSPKGAFAVYAVTEVGRAEVSAPPVEWRDTNG